MFGNLHQAFGTPCNATSRRREEDTEVTDYELNSNTNTTFVENAGISVHQSNCVELHDKSQNLNSTEEYAPSHSSRAGLKSTFPPERPPVTDDIY